MVHCTFMIAKIWKVNELCRYINPRIKFHIYRFEIFSAFKVAYWNKQFLHHILLDKRFVIIDIILGYSYSYLLSTQLITTKRSKP